MEQTSNYNRERKEVRGQLRSLYFFVALSIAVIYIVLVLVFRFGMISKFENLQHDSLVHLSHFTYHAIYSQSSDLERSARDWGYWDSTYRFMEEHDLAYIQDNLQTETLSHIGISHLLLFNPDGVLIYGIDSDGGIPGGSDKALVLEGSLWPESRKLGERQSGLVRFNSWLYSAAVSDIQTTAGEATSRGLLVMLKPIDLASLKQDLHHFEDVEVSLTLIEKGAYVEVLEVIPSDVHSHDGVEISQLSEDLTEADLVIRTVEGEQAMLVQLRAPNNILQEGLWVSTVAGIVIASMVLVATVSLTVIGLRYRKKEMSLIKKLEEMVQASDAQKNILEQNKVSLSHQLGDLAQKTDQLEKTKLAMLNVLEDQKELEDALYTEKEGVERKVEERTKELVEKTRQLEDSQRKVSEGWVQVQQEKARLMASIYSLGMGFLMTDKEGNVILVNKRLNELLDEPLNDGWSLEKISSRLTSDSSIQETWQDCIVNAHEFRLDNVEFRNGFLRIAMTPILVDNQSDQVLGVVILFEDVTNERKLQKTRDEFFAVASHELRTPLTAIRGNTSLIKQYYPDVVNKPEVGEMIEDIHTASVRLISIVNDFLDASRLELKKIDFKIEKFEIKPILEEAMRQLEPSALGKTMAWELEVSDEKLMVLADKQRLQQVVINLLGNALKFTTEGGVYVKAEVKDDTKVLIHIKDTGVGMSDADQKALFQKFIQVGGGEQAGLSRDTTQGTGLGLYISRLIMQGMGGGVYLTHSEVNRGSTFTIEVPKAAT